APRKRLAYRVMIRPTGVPPSTRTFLGAPPTPRFGVGEAKVQTPGAEMRCGKEGYCAECGETKWSDKTGVVPVMRGLDPRIHLLRKMFLRRWMDCRVKPAMTARASFPRKRGPMITAGGGPGSRCARPGRRSFDPSEAPTSRCTKSPPGQFHCCGIVIYNGWRNSSVSGPPRPICHPICHPRCVTIRRHNVLCI